MVERYRVPAVGAGTREDPARPKYFCEDSDIHLLYEVTTKGVHVQIFFPSGYVPQWANEPDVEHIDPATPIPPGIPEWVENYTPPKPRPPVGPEPKAPAPSLADAVDAAFEAAEQPEPEPETEPDAESTGLVDQVKAQLSRSSKRKGGKR